MILAFSTQLNGKPTYFVEKIYKSIEDKQVSGNDKKIILNAIRSGQFNVFKKTKPKLHTIREDKNNRFKPGVMIDFFINTRTKDMFRFAPKIPVVSTQKIEIRWYNTFGTPVVRVFIDNKSYACVKFDRETIITGKMLELAENDGFDTIEDFFAYFNKDFTGKIIHWTDKRY